VSNVPGAFQFLTQHLSVEDTLNAMTFKKQKLVEAVMKERGIGSKAEAEKWLDSALDKFMLRTFKEPSLRKLKE
jgi:hypothetical protein